MQIIAFILDADVIRAHPEHDALFTSRAPPGSPAWHHLDSRLGRLAPSLDARSARAPRAAMPRSGLPRLSRAPLDPVRALHSRITPAPAHASASGQRHRRRKSRFPARGTAKAFSYPFHIPFTIRDTGGTDHLPFDAVGLPAFQFIQDPLDYSSRTHHSNLDVYDHVQPGDFDAGSGDRRLVRLRGGDDSQDAAPETAAEAAAPPR